MQPREELLANIEHEARSLHAQIEALGAEAESVGGGAREYRHHRVEQLREKHEHLSRRAARLESCADDSWEDVRFEAEDVWQSLRDARQSAAGTFQWL